jgi:hypothetical protein
MGYHVDPRFCSKFRQAKSFNFLLTVLQHQSLFSSPTSSNPKLKNSSRLLSSTFLVNLNIFKLSVKSNHINIFISSNSNLQFFKKDSLQSARKTLQSQLISIFRKFTFCSVCKCENRCQVL